MNLRQLALNPKLGFRNKTVTVTEWDNATAILREPSAAAWIAWNEIIHPDDKSDTPLPTAEKTLRNTRADVVLFIDVLCDEQGEPVFTAEDTDAVIAIYGPVHSRLLHQALNLVVTGDEAEKKYNPH
ncbi:Tail assembly chaperone [Xenorhabdus poinarii G6]|uniref:Tail assembly chaperone n=1 Tax=Xenorhabdus poinarii G6 TaxID=1354304 RepID=A0A068R0L2_9GAMM|nr:phage tail assembly chaperone [Xenorhabdus poinarii]CDG20589.1 Tail assembly chaperone [Xenorhabdus poinarii G6]